MPYEIKTIKDFQALSQSKGIVLFHFWAEWNATDYLMKKILSELENNLDEKMIFASVDVDKENLFELCRSIPILNVPTLIFFKDGKQISVEVGLNSKKLEKEKEKILSKLENSFVSDV